MGRSFEAGVLRLHEDVLALRQRPSRGVPRDARDRGTERPSRLVLGAGQMGREAALAQTERAARTPENPDGCRPLGAFRPLRIVARGGLRDRVRDGPNGVLTSYPESFRLAPVAHPTGCVYSCKELRWAAL